MLQSMDDYNRLIILEKHAERKALSYLRGANFTHCLRINKTPVEIQATDSTGKKITIRGSDLYNRSTWEKFIATQGQGLDLCRLTGVVDVIAPRYRMWLLSDFTPRYKHVKSESAIQWLDLVARLVAVRRIMENKYEISISQRRNMFADEWSAVEMSTLMALNEAAKEFAQAIHHVVKEYIDHKKAPGQEEYLSERAQVLIEQVYTKHYDCIQYRTQALRDPLPPLPTGTESPFLLGDGA